MKILVTGSSGFIGTHLTTTLVSNNHEVHGVDLVKPSPLALYTHHQGDLTDPIFTCDLILNTCPHLVVHLAALTSVPRSLDLPTNYFHNNILSTCNILEAVRLHSASNSSSPKSKVIYASSSSIYGSNGVLHEGLLPQPRSPYALSKLVGEQLCALYSSTFGIPTLSLRLFNVYGPGQRTSGTYPALIASMFECAKGGRTATIYGSGDQSRDFTYVNDVVQAITLAIDSPSAPSGSVMNVCTGTPTSVNEIFELVHSIYPELLANRVGARPGDLRFVQGAPELAQSTLGFKASWSLIEGLANMYSKVTEA